MSTVHVMRGGYDADVAARLKSMHERHQERPVRSMLHWGVVPPPEAPTEFCRLVNDPEVRIRLAEIKASSRQCAGGRQ